MRTFVENLSRAIAQHVYAEIEAREAEAEGDTGGAGMYRGALEESRNELSEALEEMVALRAQVIEAKKTIADIQDENDWLRSKSAERLEQARVARQDLRRIREDLELKILEIDECVAAPPINLGREPNKGAHGASKQDPEGDRSASRGAFDE